MVAFDTRLIAAVCALSLVPVAYYLLGTGRNVVALSLLSVVIVVASLYLMLSPSDRAVAGE